MKRKELLNDNLNVGHRQRMKKRYGKLPIRSFDDYELLEMLLYNVYPRRDTRIIAKKLMDKFKTLVVLVNASAKELEEIDGVGSGVVLQLKLLRDLFSRLIFDVNFKETIVDNWMSVVRYCTLTMGFSKKESFKLMLLDSKNRLIKDIDFSVGTVDRVAVYPREVVELALENQASAVILAHNHPSGYCEPSKADIKITQDIAEALNTLSIKLHDHLILSKSGHFSFRAKGLL